VIVLSVPIIPLARVRSEETAKTFACGLLRAQLGKVQLPTLSNPILCPLLGDSPYPCGQCRFGLGGCVMSVSTVGLWKGRAMDKILCYGSLGVAILMFLLFLLDLFAKTPFGGGPFVTVDVFGVLASGIVAYLAWNASKDLK
jgi:hypothetical protein